MKRLDTRIAWVIVGLLVGTSIGMVLAVPSAADTDDAPNGPKLIVLAEGALIGERNLCKVAEHTFSTSSSSGFGFEKWSLIMDFTPTGPFTGFYSTSLAIILQNGPAKDLSGATIVGPSAAGSLTAVGDATDSESVVVRVSVCSPNTFNLIDTMVYDLAVYLT